MNDQIAEQYLEDVPQQIVLLAKHYRSRDWQSLSIPRSRPRLTDKREENV